jgi:hypothetical protein
VGVAPSSVARVVLALAAIGAVIAVVVSVARADTVDVDWARGLVVATAVGVADRHAPSPAVARGTAKRVAEDLAKKQIAAKLPAIAFASGTLGDKLKDAQVKARVDRAVDAAISLAAEPETDGAWKVTLAVPIEALRMAVAGSRLVDAKGDSDPAVVVVDGVAAKPAIGWKVGTLAAATLWVDKPPTWAKDAPHVRAKSAKHGTVELDRAIGGPGTLFVLVH